MKNTNRQARAWLDNATREEIKGVMKEAMFTSQQKKVLLMRKRKKSNISIAWRLHCDVRTICREVAIIYEKVNKIVFGVIL